LTRRSGIAIPSGCTLNDRHGIGLEDLGAAFATVDVAHDALLYTIVTVLRYGGPSSSCWSDRLLSYRSEAKTSHSLCPSGQTWTSSTSHDLLSLHAAISDVNLVEMPCAVSGLTLSLYLHPIGHQSDAPRLARPNSRLFSSTTSVLGRIGSLSSSPTHSTFDRRQRVDHILFSFSSFVVRGRV
jgi:hypothetical protein